jgi:hypothetical protein
VLEARAARYFEDFRGTRARATLLHKRSRSYSTIYRFALSTDAASRHVFVKLRAADDRAGGDRPRATPRVEPGDELRLAHAALVAIHERFAALGDPRLGSVRALDLIPELDALVTEEAEGSQLWPLVAGASRLRPTAVTALGEILGNTGRWLREFHGIEGRPGVATVHDGRDGFFALLDALCDFLGRSLDDQRYFDHIATRTSALAELVIPETSAHGLLFGDYGLTNVLAGPGTRVTALDTLGNWRTPIFLDIAYFLTGIKTHRQQIAMQGRAFSTDRIAALERDFLHGYFASSSPPLEQIRLYEVLKVLERWSGRLALNRRRPFGMRQVGFMLVNRFFRSVIVDLLSDAERITSSSSVHASASV